MTVFRRCLFNPRIFNCGKSARGLRRLLIQEFFQRIKNASKTERITLREVYRIAFNAVGEYNDCYTEPPYSIGKLNLRRIVTDAWTSVNESEGATMIKEGED